MAEVISPVNFSSEIPIDVKMEATVEPLPSGTLKGEVDPLKNGEMHGQKSAMNGKVKGVVNDVKQQLSKTAAILGENGMYDEPSLTQLEKELKELRLEVVELKPYRDNAPKLEKDVKDLHEALKQSESKVQQQQEQIEQLQIELQNTKRASPELALEKEALETSSGEEIRQLQEQLRSSEWNLQQEKEQIEQLQMELENTQRTSAELTLEKEDLETRSGEEIRLLQEQLRSSVLNFQQEKVAREKAWAELATLRAAAERLVVEHRDTMNTALKEHKQLAERVKEQEIILRRLHLLLPGVDDLVDCQRHLAELTGDDIQLTAHMRECQSCQPVVTHFLFHIKTCHRINCDRCAYVRQLYCGHVLTCEREGCDITGCEETKQAIRDSQLSSEELQNNKQFRDKISVHLRRITSPSCGTAECGGIFRAFQQRGYWAVAVGPVNLHRHQISNRLLQMCFRILPFTVSQAEQAIIACLSHSNLWSSCSHRKRCLVCNVCLTSLRSCASCTLPSCEICIIGAIACARHSINCTTENCKIPFCRYYKHCVRHGDTVYPSPTVLALFRESIRMLNHPPITGGLL